jgi:protein-tyrosine phosphatase
VYDGSSSKIKDATPCVKMLEKFANEGWSGASYIIRGGFTEFSRKFPYLVSDSAALGGVSSSFTSASFSGPLPPVIGGCPMPITENAANPFFGNIRQNMDLIGGVGQMPVKTPASMTRQQAEELPQWLKVAGNSNDDGKLVSEKFLHIEKKEQRRMQDALSDNVIYGSPKQDLEKPVQLAGIEKGSKNRYNNIWPFEHSRVKLQGIPFGGCDYINANHIKTEWSNKTYIATQGPIPATFKVSEPSKPSSPAINR